MTLLLEGLAILVLLLIPGLMGSIIVHRYSAPSFRLANREAADPVWAIAGGAFGLLLGFMVINLWTDLQTAQGTVQTEANDLVNLYNLSYGLPDVADGQSLRDQIVNYTQLLVDQEWDALGRHQESKDAGRALQGLWDSYMGIERRAGASNQALDGSIQHISEVQDARNQRVNAAKNVVPVALWVVLLGGVVIVIAMTWFTGSANFRTHLLTTATLAITLAAVLFLIRAFNNPFQGDIRADPEPLERALEHFRER